MQPLQRVLDCGIVAVVRATDSSQLVEVCRALVEGGVDVAEITFTVHAAELQGKVVKADSAGLMQVNLGSDDGLQRGHTLELFRLDPPAYLGRVKVIEVNPKDAVAQPLDRLNGKPAPGDSVSSRIR